MKRSYAALFVAAVTAVCCVAAEVTFVQGDKKIDVMIGGKLFTSYLFDDKLTKPVLWPLVTLGSRPPRLPLREDRWRGDGPSPPHRRLLYV